MADAQPLTQNPADWLLEQRMLYEAGMLELHKANYLNETMPTWYVPVRQEEFGRSLVSADPGLNRACELWWNAKGLSPTPLTFAQIRSLAGL